MHNATRKFSPALLWVTGISIILLCMTGSAALLGWIPSSFGSLADSSVADWFLEKVTIPVAPDEYRTPGLLVEDTVLKPRCVNCGVIESTRVIDSPGKTAGVGVVGGAVVGGVLGNQVGGGYGKDLLTIVGAVGGAAAGNEFEKRARSTRRYETTVRFNDGTSRVYDEFRPPPWQTGDRVKVMNGVIRLHG